MSGWRRIYPNPLKKCSCGEIATQSRYAVTAAEGYTGVAYFCDLCADYECVRLSALPSQGGRQRGSRPYHGEFGRSNSDTSSNVSQSIPNWGTKIKARTA